MFSIILLAIYNIIVIYNISHNKVIHLPSVRSEHFYSDPPGNTVPERIVYFLLNI